MYRRDYSWAAGGFYPTDVGRATQMIDDCMAAPLPLLTGEPLLVAGIVPHAGWVFSGPTAGKVFKALSKRDKAPHTAICFGSVHVPGVRKATIITEGSWRTPLGDLAIDSEIAQKLMAAPDCGIEENNHPHEEEHSLEVVFPFLKKIHPDVKIVPIMVPPTEQAAPLGNAIGERLKADNVIFIGSTDLTHYGSRFGFSPAGRGAKAVEWVKAVNDRRMIDLVLGMDAEDIVAEAQHNQNACGPGAIAATVAAARALGAKKGFLLEQTTSHDVHPSEGADTFVGYAGIVF